MEIIGIVATVIFGLLLCFFGGFVILGNNFFGGRRFDWIAGWVIAVIGANIVFWTLKSNVVLKVVS